MIVQNLLDNFTTKMLAWLSYLFYCIAIVLMFVCLISIVLGGEWVSVLLLTIGIFTAVIARLIEIEVIDHR